MHRVVMLDRKSLSSETNLKPLATDVSWQEFDNTAPHQVIERITEADIVALNKVVIDRSVIEQCTKLRHIAVAATGYNVVDIKACRDHDISVSNIPDYAATSVAEHVINVSLCLRRELIQYRQQVIVGAWQKSPGFCLFDKPINDLRGATFGIIGMGRIGQHTAKLAAAMGMRVVFKARRSLKLDFAQQLEFDELLECSDIISLHCDLNESTNNLIGLAELDRMQDHTILINTARGGIVNENALTEAIEAGSIGGAAVDVLVEEPPKNHSPLLTIADRSNVIITPHTAWASQQAMQSLANILIDNIDGALAGQPQNLV